MGTIGPSVNGASRARQLAPAEHAPLPVNGSELHRMKRLAPLDDWLITLSDLRRSDPLTSTNRVDEKSCEVLRVVRHRRVSRRICCASAQRAPATGYVAGARPAFLCVPRARGKYVTVTNFLGAEQLSDYCIDVRSHGIWGNVLIESGAPAPPTTTA